MFFEKITIFREKIVYSGKSQSLTSPSPFPFIRCGVGVPFMIHIKRALQIDSLLKPVLTNTWQISFILFKINLFWLKSFITPLCNMFRFRWFDWKSITSLLHRIALTFNKISASDDMRKRSTRLSSMWFWLKKIVTFFENFEANDYSSCLSRYCS